MMTPEYSMLYGVVRFSLDPALVPLPSSNQCKKRRQEKAVCGDRDG